MNVFITRYALTQGIKRRDVELAGDGMVRDRSTRFSVYYRGESREWHRDFESAVARADVLRRAKIAAMQKTIARLAAIDFAASVAKP